MCIVFHSLKMFSSFRGNSSSAPLFMAPQTQCSTHLQRHTIKQPSMVCFIIVCFDWLQGELLSPCRCAGSVRHAHQQCLLKWISEKGSWSCELCNYRFNILPIHIKPPQQVNTHTGIYNIVVSIYTHSAH